MTIAILSLKEQEEVYIIQREILEVLGRHEYKYDEDKNFEIYSISIAFVISSLMHHFGITEPWVNKFLDDMVNTTKSINKNFKGRTYMEFCNGEKINEGNIN